MQLPAEAEKLIATHRLGAPKKVYKPNTIGSIIVGSLVIAFACVWIAFALMLTGSYLLPTDQTSTLFPYVSAPPDSSFATIMSVLGIVFPLVGLVFVGVGLAIIVRALLNQHVRAVLCEDGVAYLARDKVDAFRWEQVADVFDKVSVHTSTTDNMNGGTSTSTTISH